MTRSKNSSGRWRFTVLVIAALIILSLFLYKEYNPLLAYRIVHAAAQGPLVFFEIHAGWCCMCADLNQHIQTVPPEYLRNWTLYYAKANSDADRERAFDLLQEQYGIDLHGHGYPIFLVFRDGKLVSYGTGFDNQDALMGFYPQRTPVRVADVFINPEAAINYSQYAPYNPIPPNFSIS